MNIITADAAPIVVRNLINGIPVIVTKMDKIPTNHIEIKKTCS